MVTVVALKFAMKSHFPLPKNVAVFNGSDSLSSRSSFCFCQMAWQGIESPKQTIEFSGCTILLLIEKMNQINSKTIGNRKRNCAWGCARGDKHHLRKYADRKAQIRKVFFPIIGLICAFRSADFLRWCLSPRAQPHAQSLFLFPIVFGINTPSSERNSKRTCSWPTDQQRIHLLFLSEEGVYTETSEIPLLSSFSSPVS